MAGGLVIVHDVYEVPIRGGSVRKKEYKVKKRGGRGEKKRLLWEVQRREGEGQEKKHEGFR